MTASPRVALTGKHTPGRDQCAAPPLRHTQSDAARTVVPARRVLDGLLDGFQPGLRFTRIRTLAYAVATDTQLDPTL